MSVENSLHALLAFFFYEHGYLVIPRLGRFDLSENAGLHPGQPHGLQVFPEGSVSFTYNPREKPDEELIDYIIARSRKMRALAISDMDSIADITKEMLNIGQSYTFPGIGTIEPSLSGIYKVTSAKIISSPAAVKASAPPSVHQGGLNPVIREGEVHSTDSRRTVGSISVIVLCLLIIGLLLYFFFFRSNESMRRKKESGSNKEMLVRPARDTAKEDHGPSDGLIHYEVIFEHATHDRALYRYRQLTGWGHPVILHTTDSLHYTLAVKIASSASDTARVKDSVRALYGHPVSIRYLSR